MIYAQCLAQSSVDITCMSFIGTGCWSDNRLTREMPKLEKSRLMTVGDKVLRAR